jgi:hypothetical protein
MQSRRNSNQWCIITKTLSSRLSTTDWLQALFHMMFWRASSHMSSKLQPRKTWYLLSNLHWTFSKLKSHTSTHQLQMNAHSSSTYQWSPMPTYSIYMNSCHYQSISTSPPTFQSLRMSNQQTSSSLDTLNPFKPFPALTYMPASTSETLSFAKEGRRWN